MYIKLLSIKDSNKIIRKIPFHKGLNLILDETNSEDLKETGNNVGKTTVLRLVDFCLGSDGKNIYRDSEFPEKSNTQIEDYLTNNNIIIELVLKENLDDKDSEEITIERNFLKRKNKTQKINGTDYSNNKEFEAKLKKLIFNTEVEKPTLRQIVSKNIRDEKNKLINTLKVLHFATTLEQYEALYFFWFGIDTDTADRKQKLTESKKFEEKIINRLKKENTESAIKQALVVINRDIKDLEKQKKLFNLKDSYEDEINNIQEIKNDLNSHTTEIGRLEIRRKLIAESKQDLENEIADIDISNLEVIYTSANRFIPQLQKTFSELVSFHNKMIKNKVKFISKELPQIEERLDSLYKEMTILSEQEYSLKLKLENLGYINELEEIFSKLNDKYEQKGKYEEQLNQWRKSQENLESIDDELRDINEGIQSLDKSLEKRVKSFNKYFSKLTERLYNEQFILSYDNKNNRAYQLEISSISGNPGTGKKKGQIAAFDFAYIQFCEENNISCLHFILHDQIENIHDNQLITLASIANETNSQFIVPVLKDKLPSNINVNKCRILSLSQDDKLFRIPAQK